MSDLAFLAVPCPHCGHHTLYRPEGYTEGGPVMCANACCDSNHPPEPELIARGPLVEIIAQHPDPRCDEHPDGEPIACGWKRAYAALAAAVQGAPGRP